jgi:hypothetical protein
MLLHHRLQVGRRKISAALNSLLFEFPPDEIPIFLTRPFRQKHRIGKPAYALVLRVAETLHA